MIEGPLKGHLWSAETTPHAKGIMAAFDDPTVRKLYFLAPSQSGKTTIAYICLFSALRIRPDNAGIGMPDKESAIRAFQGKLHRFFTTVPALKRMLRPDRDALQATEIQMADGSRLFAMWSGSEGSMRSQPMPYVIVDEPDAYGDPAAMNTMQERADAYHAMELSKIMLICRPKGTEEQSVTWADATKQAQAWMRYRAVCPACRTPQVMEHDHIVSVDGTHDPLRIRQEHLGRYKCLCCGYLWNDATRNVAIREGHWENARAKAPRADDYGGASIVAFHFRSWESPLVSLSDVLADWFEAQGNPRLLQLFDNNRCAKPYRFVRVESDWQTLRANISDRPQGLAPAWTAALTLSVDTQMDHFFWSIAAHGLDPSQLHVLDYGRVRAFGEVAQILETAYRTEDGRSLGIWRAAIDTGGGRDRPFEDSRTLQTYRFVMSLPPGRLYGTKGMSRRTPGVFVDVRAREQTSDGRRLKHGFSLHFIDTDSLKRALFWRLTEGREEEPVTFHSQTGEDYLRQIASERLEQGRNGAETWVRYRDNHYLDCLVGHLAMEHWQWKPSLSQLVAAAPPASMPKQQPEIGQSGLFDGSGLFGA